MQKVDKGHKPTLSPPVTGKHVAVTIIEHIYQSQPSPTIHYTYDETLEGGTGAEIITTHDSKARVWRWLWMMNSNLNLAKPFSILMVREWKGWDAVNCPNQSKLTLS
eukprot:scaffold57779_cov43-Cyclotella_meneghiniana.AAC.1